jgi:hypothetical protein
MIQKYRKKPVVIEALQFTPERALAALEGTTKLPFGLIACGAWTWNKNTKTLHDAYITIKTLEGNMKASLGDYIIKGVKGELYPCKPEIFASTCEEEPTNG